MSSKHMFINPLKNSVSPAVWACLNPGELAYKPSLNGEQLLVTLKINDSSLMSDSVQPHGL